MLPKEIEVLVVKIYANLGDEAKKKAKANPEAWLISLLERIDEDLPGRFYAPVASVVNDAKTIASLREQGLRD